MKSLPFLAGIIIFVSSCHSVPAYAHTKQEYLNTFIDYVHTMNPLIDASIAEDLGEQNWDVSDGIWIIARRLAAEENMESGNFKLAAWMPDRQPPGKNYPRYDALGSHLELCIQEAKRLKIYAFTSTATYSDSMEFFLDQLAHDPAYGTWLVAHAYVRKARVVGLDRASHFWQTGKSYFVTRDAYLHDPYLNNIWKCEENSIS